VRGFRSWKFVFSGITIGLALFACGAPNRSPQELVSDLAGEEAVQSYRILERSQDKIARHTVVAGLSDPNARVRSQCARIIGSWKDTAFIEVLRPALEDKTLVVRREAARSLVRLLDTDQVLQILLEAQTNLQASRELAAWLLRDWTELAHHGFFQWLTDAGHPMELRVALWDLIRDLVGREFRQEKIAAQELVPVIVERKQLLTDLSRALAFDEREPLALRCSALFAYAALARERSVDGLIEVLLDVKNSHRFRDAALVALGHSQSELAIAPLCRVFRDESTPLSTREAALLGLQRLWEHPAAFATLEEALRDNDPRLRLTAARMTKDLVGERFRPLLEQALARELDAQVTEELSHSLNRGQRSRRKRVKE